MLSIKQGGRSKKQGSGSKKQGQGVKKKRLRTIQKTRLGC